MENILSDIIAAVCALLCLAGGVWVLLTERSGGDEKDTKDDNKDKTEE